MSIYDNDARSGGIQVIARAAEILRQLQSQPSGLNQAEIGERVGMARSTVSRILNALDDEGLVASPGPRGRYRLGPEIARMSRTIRHSIVTDLHPLIAELSWQLEETVDLSILDGDRAHYVDQVVSPRRVWANSSVGGSSPLYCCANGKAMLAAMSPEVQAKALPTRLVPLTRNTITNHAMLREQIQRIRSEGVSFDRQEQMEGLCAVGAALPMVSEPLVAVSVTVPAQRFYGREEELAHAVLAWVRKVNTLS